MPGGAGAPGPTGDPRVDAVVARLDELAGLPVPAHVEVFADVHQRLQELLVSADEEGDTVASLGGTPGPGGMPGAGGSPRPGGMPGPGGTPRPGGMPGGMPRPGGAQGPGGGSGFGGAS